MTLRRILPIAFAGAVLGHTPALASVEGVWMGKDGTTLRIRNCGDAVCGNVASVPEKSDPGTGVARTDAKNADPNLRNRPLVGIQVLIAMRPNGPGKWSGRLYNVGDGNTYAGNLIELGPDTVRVEGCWLGVCGGENLTRMKSSDNPVRKSSVLRSAASSH
jgi:uncharacterized protein (DUF2147 family)